MNTPNGLSQETRQGIHDLFASVLKQKLVPGLGYTVVTEEETCQGWLGCRDLTTGEPMGEDCLYDCASLTKVMVTTPLILRAARQGRLKLADPLSAYLPDYQGPATIAQCLLHSSGYRPGQIDYRYMKKEELIRAVLQHPVDPSIQGKCCYSDVNFLLLGFLLEALYQEPLERLSQREIFAPLGMRDTGYLPKDRRRCVAYEITPEEGVIRGRVHDGKAWRLGGVAGHAGLFTTVNDAAVYLQACLRRDERLLDAESFALLDEAYSFNELGDARTYGWAIRAAALYLPPQFGRHRLMHTGFTGNFFLVDHDSHLAIGIFTNRIHPSRQDKRILQAFPGICVRILQLLQQEEQ